jgi:hypothetical protein
MVPLASNFQTGAVLTLVVPVAIFILVAIWYVAIWHEHSGGG